jgi:hypothetical protein
MTINFTKAAASNQAADVTAHQKANDHDGQIFKAVERYLKKDLHVLPFDRKAGYCTLAKAEQLAFSCSAGSISSNFKGMDVGVDLQASKLVGIDVDCAEVAAFLHKLLPPTCVIRRESKATSWLFFRLEGAIPKNISFRDLDLSGKAASELGGVKVNAAVALPPSKHRKTSETLEWVSAADPAPINSTLLMTLVRKCFAMALVARHWPGAGNRHDATLALAGALARAGWSVDEAENVVQVLASVTNDSKLDDRLAEVKSTYDHLKKGEHTSGLPSLVKFLDPTPEGQAYLESSLREWLGLNETAISLEGAGSGQGLNAPLSKYALSLTDLMGMELPEQEFIVHPWLPVQALIMFFAARGVGKTWAALELAISVACGRDFFAWPVPKPRGVLFIDGEMPLTSLQFRLRKLLGTTPIPPELTIISSELLLRDNAPLNICRLEQQQRIDDLLTEMKLAGKSPSLIILDNLSSLISGIDENSNSDLDLFNLWLVKLRSQGYAVVAVHHAGKNGDQRGASRKEDLLDTVVKLEKREGLNLAATEGACFEVKFSKLRGEAPKPISLVVALTTDGHGNHQWQYEEGQKQPAYMKVMQGILDHKPLTQIALAKQLGCSRQHVSTMVNLAVEKGLLIKVGLCLTQKGTAALAATTQDVQTYADAM